MFALFSLSGLFCFPCALSHGQGNLQRTEYFELWDTIQQEVSDHIGYSLYQDTQTITSVLERYNIFVVDDRDIDGSVCWDGSGL
jgi:hypothetical protein